MVWKVNLPSLLFPLPDLGMLSCAGDHGSLPFRELREACNVIQAIENGRSASVCLFVVPSLSDPERDLRSQASARSGWYVPTTAMQGSSCLHGNIPLPSLSCQPPIFFSFAHLPLHMIPLLVPHRWVHILHLIRASWISLAHSIQLRQAAFRQPSLADARACLQRRRHTATSC